MTRANGSFDFLSSECVVGTAFKVDRTYLGGQFASGEGVTLVCRSQLRFLETELSSTLTFGGRMASGGG
jgi:hypothetical protein